MSNTYPEPEPKTADTMRREAVEIKKRRQRGLPAYRASNLPLHAEADPEAAAEALAEGRVLFQQKRYADAMLRADVVRGRVAAGSDLWADGMILRAEVAMAQGSVQSARETLRRVLHQNEGNVTARLLVAESYRRAGMHGKAIELFLAAIPLLPDPAERTRWQKTLADSYIASGQPAMARRVLRVTEKPEAVPSSMRFKTAAAYFIPTTTAAWLLLVALIFVTLFAVGNLSFPINLLIVLGCIAAYGIVQWVQSPRTRRHS